MARKVLAWFGLVSVITLGLFGPRFYLTLLMFLISFFIGVITILFLAYDNKKMFSDDFDILDDPLQKSNFSVQSPKILQLFQTKKPLPKFDNRITGSETVDSFLNEIINIIINDHVTCWYEILTNDEEFTTQIIKKVVLSASANVSNRVKSVNWIHLLSTRFPEELTTHLKLYKQSNVRMKHVNLMSAKEFANGNSKPCVKKQEEKKTHKRNKSDTDLSWLPDIQTYGKSKFYASSENLEGKTLNDLFFDLECSIEHSQICRDIYCTDKEKENALLCEVAETVLYLISPEEVWRCHALKMLLIDLLSSVVLKPLIDLLCNPDNINRMIVRTSTPDSTLPSDLFLMVIRCCGDAEELDATLELVYKDIQKLHSKDSAGEWELSDRQKLSSLEYLTRIIQARKVTLGPQEGTSSNNTDKIPEDITRSLKFLRASASWRSNAQYLLEIELNEADATTTSKAVIDNLRSSALELCDLYLAPNRPPVRGIPENCHAELVRKITMEGEEFTNNPVVCFDDVQKCICDALEDDPTWQADFMMDGEDGADRATSEFKEDKTVSSKYSGDSLSVPVSTRHNRSRSDIVGNFAQKMMNESAGSSNLSPVNTGISLSHSNISQNVKNILSPLSACIIETALVQEKGRPFGIYAIAVTRLSDNELWHIYRRYSDFHDLHSSIKDKWPELGHLPFPAKKTFQNTSRSVLESRKRMLNNYLQNLVNLAREARYMTLLSPDYLGGFLSAEAQAEKQNNTIDAVLVNSLKAGMRTLKNMPDQFANTVDGVMDGISKVFQGKNSETFNEGFKSGNSSDTQDDDESVALKLLEEVLGIRGLWLRRRLLAPLRTLIADRVNNSEKMLLRSEIGDSDTVIEISVRKVYEFVSSLTSPRNVVQYLKTFKQWLTTRNNANYSVRDAATKARTRVAAKVALLSACSDDLKHIVGTDTARRGLLTVFDLFQTEEINKRLIFVFLEVILMDLFPDNNIQDLFKKLYSHSPRVPAPKKSTLV